ncbi:hypothetical protein CEXT_701391 [Caerostris extrusa]|uniref:Uncharacterized protein n=1 Tax=Caerostris extrusa TaxID=172846 RepID=A0AAV4VVY5_CAEEX|nr:hypothetical protein CEXT_701391 [Caerostris extrusa]
MDLVQCQFSDLFHEEAQKPPFKGRNCILRCVLDPTHFKPTHLPSSTVSVSAQAQKSIRILFGKVRELREKSDCSLSAIFTTVTI